MAEMDHTPTPSSTETTQRLQPMLCEHRFWERRGVHLGQDDFNPRHRENLARFKHGWPVPQGTMLRRRKKNMNGRYILKQNWEWEGIDPKKVSFLQQRELHRSREFNYLRGHRWCHFRYENTTLVQELHNNQPEHRIANPNNQTLNISTGNLTHKWHPWIWERVWLSSGYIVDYESKETKNWRDLDRNNKETGQWSSLPGSRVKFQKNLERTSTSIMDTGSKKPDTWCQHGWPFRRLTSVQDWFDRRSPVLLEPHFSPWSPELIKTDTEEGHWQNTRNPYSKLTNMRTLKKSNIKRLNFYSKPSLTENKFDLFTNACTRLSLIRWLLMRKRQRYVVECKAMTDIKPGV